jgi:hypothetical protein
MRYNHESFLPARAFKPRGSVVGGRSISVHGGDSWLDFWQAQEDPRYSSSQGQWVTIDADAGGVWQPITVGAPVGQYETINADAGGQWVENSPAQMAAINAQLEADRQAKLQQAAAYVASNPLAISGNQIATPYGNQNVSMFRPLVEQGQAVTGSTPTQLIDPATGMPVYLSNPNDPYSYTYDVTGTPARGGTLEQQAALFRPVSDKGVFGTIGGDLLSAVKDPYFHNFLAAAAAMGGAAALAPASGAVGGAQAFPVSLGGSAAGTGGLGASLTALGPTSTSAAAGFGSIGSALGAGATGASLTGLGATGAGAASAFGSTAAPSASTFANLLSRGAQALSGSYGDLIKGGLTLGGLAAASALAPKSGTEAGTQGFSNEELQAIVSMMPSAMGQYLSNAKGGVPGAGGAPVSMAELFPGFSLPTTGEYGAGRFGVGYAPTAPTVGLV